MTKVETKIPSKQQEQTTNVVGGTEEAKLSIVKTTLDLVKKQIELLVENIGDDGVVTAATIILAINEDTSSIKLDADKLDLNANNIINLIANNTINLSTKNIIIESDNFSVSAIGEIMAKLGKIGGFNITENTLYAQNYAKNNYTTNDRDLLQAYLMGQASLTDEQKAYLDANSDGILDITDLLLIQKIIDYNVTTTNPITISMNSGINGLNSAYVITDGNGTERLKLSIDGVRTTGAISCQNIFAANIDSGTCNLNSNGITWVPFNKTFSDTPSVIITPNTSASGVVAPKIRTVYTNGFDAIIGGSGFSNINCNWIAISS